MSRNIKLKIIKKNYIFKTNRKKNNILSNKNINNFMSFK